MAKRIPQRPAPASVPPADPGRRASAVPSSRRWWRMLRREQARQTARRRAHSRRTFRSASRSSNPLIVLADGDGGIQRLLGAVHAPGLPHRSRDRRRGGVPVPWVAVPARRHRGGRPRHPSAPPLAHRAGPGVRRMDGPCLLTGSRRPPSCPTRVGTFGDIATAAVHRRRGVRRRRRHSLSARRRVRLHRDDAAGQSRRRVLPEPALLEPARCACWRRCCTSGTTCARAPKDGSPAASGCG